jgi:teichuronic acid biosynthesis glycosyltransferase TuaC
MMKPNKPMRILIVTNMLPLPEDPSYGIFIAEQAASLRDAGAIVDVLFINGRYNPLAYFAGIFRLWWQLLFHHPRYHVIHAHHAFTGIIARLQWALPLVVTIHEGDANSRGIKSALARIAAALSTQPIAVNPAIAGVLGKKRSAIIPCGVDTNLFRKMDQAEARKQLGWDLQEKVVLFGSDPNRPEKRYALAQSVLAEVAQMGTQARLFPLLGVTREQVPIIMSACDALLVTSGFESGPLVVKEALAVGLPVVSVPVGDVREVCRDKAHCYVVEDKLNLLAIALLAAINVEPGERREQLSQWYDQQCLTTSLLKLYRKLI